MMEYKGYVAGPIEFDPEEKTFAGTVQGLRGVIHFEGANADGLWKSLRGSIDSYLTLCAEEGRAPETAQRSAEAREELISSASSAQPLHPLR
jgi:predicted HicB family RNase H-like nuclease